MDYSQYIVPGIIILVGVILFLKIHAQGQASSPITVVPTPPPPGPILQHPAPVVVPAPTVAHLVQRIEDLHYKLDSQRPAKEGGDRLEGGKAGSAGGAG